MKIKTLFNKFHISNTIKKCFTSNYDQNFFGALSQFNEQKSAIDKKPNLKYNPFQKNTKLYTLLNFDKEKRIHEESLVSSLDHNSNLKHSDSEDLFMNIYNYYKNNLNEIISTRYIRKYGETLHSTNEPQDPNKYLDKNFSYIYFHLTLMTVLKKFDSTHNMLAKKVDENFKTNFDLLDLKEKLFITKLASLNNNMLHLNTISSFYKRIFSKQYNFESYQEEIAKDTQFDILFQNFHVIIRFFGILPKLAKEELSEVILNIYRTISNLSMVIFKTPEQYFFICKV